MRGRACKTGSAPTGGVPTPSVQKKRCARQKRPGRGNWHHPPVPPVTPTLPRSGHCLVLPAALVSLPASSSASPRAQQVPGRPRHAQPRGTAEPPEVWSEDCSRLHEALRGH
jgi:hypothetical protein